MKQDYLYTWLESIFTSLPKTNEEGYRAIWRKGALRFGMQGHPADLVDELNARLISLALSEPRQLLIVLPDRLQHRGAFLFATALLLDSMDRIQHQLHGGQVLYFGSTIGIREHLGQVYINDLCLASVFPQTQLRRTLKEEKDFVSGKGRSKKPASLIASNLPAVLCTYSPVDPIAICEKNKANWFAADCTNEMRLRWLSPLVAFAKEQNIPIVAWTQNPLSSAVEDFKAAGGQVLTWPAWTHTEAFPTVGSSVANGLRTIFSASRQCSIYPIVLETQPDNEETESLHHAYIALSKATHFVNTVNTSRLAKGAIQIGWKYLRALENLCIPLTLFEAEVENFWGTSSLGRIRETFSEYLDALTRVRSSICPLLIDIQEYLHKAHNQLQQQVPSLWKAIVNLCIENVAMEMFRLIIFPTNSYKKLFSLGLLAYYNISEADLRQISVGLISLREFYDFLTLLPQKEAKDMGVMQETMKLPKSKVQWECWMVGLPSMISTPYLEPALCHGKLQVVVYPYQLTVLARRIEKWESMVYPNIDDYVSAAAIITNRTRPLSTLINPSPKFILEDAKRYASGTLTKVVPTQEKRLDIWEPFDLLNEFSILMDEDFGSELNDVSARIDYKLKDNIGNIGKDVIEEIWLIEFTSGEYVLLDLNEKVNVIVSAQNGSKTDERYASSLRTGDRIVFIHGQRRQSLLDLVLSRVYCHSAVNLHVKLVERWKEDFAVAYQYRVMSQPGRDLDGLLEEMRALGSKISGVQSLRNWLHGETLRPHDQEDLRRLAEIFKLDFVHHHYKRIHQAGSRLAGLHVSLSRRLNAWINGEIPDIIAYTPDRNDTIDEQLGLTFDDFRDSLTLLQVREVSREKGLFGREMLGQLKKGKPK